MRDESIDHRNYSDEDVLDPGFRLEHVTDAQGECRKLYIQVFERRGDVHSAWRAKAQDAWPLLAVIRQRKLEMHPIHTNPHAQRYLGHRHGPVQLLVYEDGEEHQLPEFGQDAATYVENRLPWRLFNPCREGLGLLSELDPMWAQLRGACASRTLIISRAGQPGMDGNSPRVSVEALDSVRRRFARMDRVGRENIKDAKGAFVRNVILPDIDPERYPRIEMVPRGRQLVELRIIRSNRPSSSPVGRQRSVQEVRENLQAIADHAPQQLMQLHADIERVSVERMIEVFEQMLAQDLSEDRWQRFFSDNVFVLSLVFARAVRLLHTQFRARTSGIDGSGAQIGDFLLAEQGLALAIVEIKKPGTELVSATAYRNQEVFAPSRELSGAVTQVLVQQSELRSNWLSHRGEASLQQSRPDAIKCVVIAGRLPTDHAKKRSFEVFRNACKDVEVVTFDELLGKLHLLRQHLAPPAEPPIQPVPVGVSAQLFE